MKFVREIGKLYMFTLLFAIPVGLAIYFQSPVYLWFFIMSIACMISMFSHYEDLEKNVSTEKCFEDYLDAAVRGQDRKEVVNE